MPEIVGDESVGIKYAINGLLSLTPDGLPILGETPEVRGLWSAAAVWVKEGPGVGRAVAEWMVARRARDRPAGVRHRPLLRAPEERRARQGARRRGLQQDLRDRPSGRAVGVEPRRPPVAVPRARARARRGVLRGRRLGAPALVRVQRAGWSRSTASQGREAEWDVALVVADHQRRAPRDARPRGDVRPDRVLRLRRRRPGRARVRADGLDAPDGRQARQGRLHAGADAARRLPLRPDRDAARRGALPRRHRRRARDGGPQVVPRPPAGGRQRADLRPHVELVHARRSGARARATSSRARRATTSRTRASRSRPAARSRSARCACSRRASPTSATSAGSSTCRSSRARSCGTWSRRRARRTAIVPAGIGVYATTGRLEKCYRAFGFELDGEYDVVEAGMAWGKVKEQDFVGKEAHVRQRESEPAAVHVHADRRRPHGERRPQALHARRRADRHARRRAARRRQGPPLVRHERRRRARRSASTS